MNLEEAQKEAGKINNEILNHNKSPLLIVAGPGTGKSTKVAERTAFLIDHKGVPPDKIYLLSFTNASANDLREKLEKKTKRASEILLSTVHGLANKILRENSKDNYYISDFLDDMIIAKDAYPTKSRQELKDFLRMRNKSVANSKKEDNQQYDKIKNFYKSFNFYEITAKVVNLFETEPQILKKYQNKIEYLIVDEYQDLNIADQKFIQLLSSSENTGLTICGDDDQSIYGFRHASPKGMVENFYSGNFTNKKMCCCWRSPTSIIEVSRPIIEMAEKELDIRRIPKLLFGEDTQDKVEIISIPSATKRQNKEAIWVAEKIKDLLSEAKEKGEKYRILVLASQREITNELKLILKDAKIPLKSWRRRILKLKKPKLLYYGLRFIQESQDNFAVRAIINLLQGNIALSEIVNLAIDKRESLWDVIKEESPPKIRNSIKMLKILETIDRNMEPVKIIDKIGDILEIAKMDKGYKKIEELAKSSENINYLLTSIANEYLDVESSEVESPIEDEQFVEIMTMHSSKGLTADCVFIMGAENEFIPGIQLTPDNIRLFYVALTRSKGKLFITFVRSRQTQLARGQNIRNRSVFVNKILENVNQRYWKYEKLS
ncbi:hypothetical protein AMJ49_01205 [Parcubacteria bacterium DG_74_2]|nr:MAG: hypothetical protein AMJ49_01205 [Parcubacteria bacterium DG_74_2]